MQAVFWYSDVDYWGVWPWSDLMAEDGALTAVGMEFVTPLRPTAGDVTAQPGRVWLPVVWR